MTELKCIAPVKGYALRATLLDDCLRPVDILRTSNSQISTAGFTTFTSTPDVEDGEEFRRRNAYGDFCINDNTDPMRTLGHELELEACDLPLNLNEMLMNYKLIPGPNGDIIGQTGTPTNGDGGQTRHATIEVWAENANANFCDENGNRLRWIRFIWTNAFRFYLSGDLTFEHDMLQWTMSGYAESNPNWRSPLGANDPDLDEEAQICLAEGGPFGFVCTNVAPAIVPCSYVNPATA